MGIYPIVIRGLCDFQLFCSKGLVRGSEVSCHLCGAATVISKIGLCRDKVVEQR